MYKMSVTQKEYWLPIISSSGLERASKADGVVSFCHSRTLWQRNTFGYEHL